MEQTARQVLMVQMVQSGRALRKYEASKQQARLTPAMVLRSPGVGLVMGASP